MGMRRSESGVGAGEVAISAALVAGDAAWQRASSAVGEVGVGLLPNPVVVFSHSDIAHWCGAVGIVVQSFDQ